MAVHLRVSGMCVFIGEVASQSTRRQLCHNNGAAKASLAALEHARRRATALGLYLRCQQNRALLTQLAALCRPGHVRPGSTHPAGCARRGGGVLVLQVPHGRHGGQLPSRLCRSASFKPAQYLQSWGCGLRTIIFARCSPARSSLAGPSLCITRCITGCALGSGAYSVERHGHGPAYHSAAQQRSIDAHHGVCSQA